MNSDALLPLSTVGNTSSRKASVGWGREEKREANSSREEGEEKNGSIEKWGKNSKGAKSGEQE